MVLEATMIIVDNSESSRNGDYLPSRFQAQTDAISLIHNAKMQDNPQNAVGLMSMAGEGPEVLSTLTGELGRLLEGIHRTKISGSTHFSSSIQVAALALKHRQERSQRQRIIVFSCSPIVEDEKSIIKLAKRMKKSAVSVDLVGFGDLDDDTRKKLELFHENVEAGGSSHLAIVPPGPSLLSDQLIGTPIMNGDGEVGDAVGGANEGLQPSDEFEFGVDPATDPELALALRMSMEEEKARLERERKEREKQDKEKEKPETIEEEKEDDKDKDHSNSGSSTDSKPRDELEDMELD
ncbi:hypothetical protein KEM54_006971 [Ascosphaera aggregata]|nr:hypothetical protein KEM54_006971 [Ascosphaera aggregata]